MIYLSTILSFFITIALIPISHQKGSTFDSFHLLFDKCRQTFSKGGETFPPFEAARENAFFAKDIKKREYNDSTTFKKYLREFVEQDFFRS